MMGCSQYSLNTPQNCALMASVVRIATAVYLDKNDATVYIIQANAFIQGLNEDKNIYNQPLIDVKNRLLRQLFDGEISLVVEESIASLTDLILNLIMEELKIKQSDLIEPEVLDVIQKMFAAAADVAESYEERK